MASLQCFHGLIFADACNQSCLLYTIQSCIFRGCNFRGWPLIRENGEIGPHENFPLYGITVDQEIFVVKKFSSTTFSNKNYTR
jgi:hypothetical protein